MQASSIYKNAIGFIILLTSCSAPSSDALGEMCLSPAADTMSAYLPSEEFYRQNAKENIEIRKFWSGVVLVNCSSTNEFFKEIFYKDGKWQGQFNARDGELTKGRWVGRISRSGYGLICIDIEGADGYSKFRPQRVCRKYYIEKYQSKSNFVKIQNPSGFGDYYISLIKRIDK